MWRPLGKYEIRRIADQVFVGSWNAYDDVETAKAVCKDLNNKDPDAYEVVERTTITTYRIVE